MSLSKPEGDWFAFPPLQQLKAKAIVLIIPQVGAADREAVSAGTFDSIKEYGGRKRVVVRVVSIAESYRSTRENRSMLQRG